MQRRPASDNGRSVNRTGPVFPRDPRTVGTENCSREPAPLSPENRASSSTALVRDRRQALSPQGHEVAPTARDAMPAVPPPWPETRGRDASGRRLRVQRTPRRLRSRRYSGVSLGYQLASITAGGPAPIVALYLLVSTRQRSLDKCPAPVDHVFRTGVTAPYVAAGGIEDPKAPLFQSVRPGRPADGAAAPGWL